jgi:serine-type D-Ala-D-Ala carboxypeptidase/endopeptidase (penicillin-binding protein 4)
LRYVAWILIFVCYSFAYCADEEFSVQSLSDFATLILNNDALQGASWSISFYSLTGDSLIYSYDPERMLSPASVTKLVTSAATLEALGPDYRFQTSVSYKGTLSSGVLDGNLIIQAGGDPTIEQKVVDSLHASVLVSWADTLKALGVSRINGDLVLRTRPFALESEPAFWEVGDIQEGFAPAVDGFGYNSNVAHLSILPGVAEGDAPIFALDPTYAPVGILSTITTVSANTKPDISYHVIWEDTLYKVSGSMPVGDDGEFLWVPIQNPSYYFGRALFEALKNRGIEVSGSIVVDRQTSPDSNGTHPLFTHYSAPLTHILSVMNKKSDNFLAESMLRILGVATDGIGSTRSGEHGIKRFLEKHGVHWSQISLVDGSGISRRDLCSANGLIQMLKSMYKHPYKEQFMSTLSIGGVDGTLGSRLNSPEFVGKVHGKTGTMTGISGVAGYIQTDRGEDIAFAILCNNYQTPPRTARAVQDRLIERAIVGSH